MSTIDILPLMSYMDIDRSLYPLPIYALRQRSSRNPKSISRILNSLNESNYITVGDLLQASMAELRCLRNFGVTGQMIVVELLEAHTINAITVI